MASESTPRNDGADDRIHLQAQIERGESYGRRRDHPGLLRFAERGHVRLGGLRMQRCESGWPHRPAVVVAPPDLVCSIGYVLELKDPDRTATDDALRHEDRERLMRSVRSDIKWMRDCGAGAIFGGATIGFGLILSGSPIRRDVYIPLMTAYGVLMLVAALYWSRAMNAVGRATPQRVFNAFAPALAIIVIGLSALRAARSGLSLRIRVIGGRSWCSHSSSCWAVRIAAATATTPSSSWTNFDLTPASSASGTEPSITPPSWSWSGT